jgi:hypothetical protein
MTQPKRKGGYEMREIGGNILLTVRAPRDGMNRNTSASDLTILFNPGEFNAFTNECIWLNAGLKR